MPLLIRIVTGLVAGGLLYVAFFGDLGHAIILGIIAVVWVFVGLALATHWEDIE